MQCVNVYVGNEQTISFFFERGFGVSIQVISYNIK